MKRSRRLNCIWLLGLLLLLACAQPAATVEAPPSPTAEPVTAAPATATPLPPIQVLLTPVPTPTPAPFAAVAVPADRKPARYLTAAETAGLFYWVEKDMYLAYGQVGNDEVGFYPADETGNVVPGSMPVDGPCLVPLYTPADPPQKEDEKLLVLYLPTQSVVAFHGENGEWIEDRIMICSSGRGGNATPVGRYTIYETYDYKLLGSEEEDTLCYGFWACRFYKGHLFHSVPISYDAGTDKAKAHRMTNMLSYQKLGTTASHGCVRMTVADAKYIYDLATFYTVNVWVTKDKGPTPPKPPKIIWTPPYTYQKKYGWDPTDPDPANPYLTAPQG